MDRVNAGCTCAMQRSRGLMRTVRLRAQWPYPRHLTTDAEPSSCVQTALTFKPSSLPISQAGWRAEAWSSGTPLLGPFVLSQGAHTDRLQGPEGGWQSCRQWVGRRGCLQRRALRGCWVGGSRISQACDHTALHMNQNLVLSPEQWRASSQGQVL